MNKKTYVAPAVRKVHLVIQNAILAVCHSSANLDPKGTLGCTVTVDCYTLPYP
jgi:hypothetical protein